MSINDEDFMVEVPFSLIKEVFTVLSESSIHLPQKYVDNVRNGLSNAAQQAATKVNKKRIEEVEESQKEV